GHPHHRQRPVHGAEGGGKQASKQQAVGSRRGDRPRRGSARKPGLTGGKADKSRVFAAVVRPRGEADLGGAFPLVLSLLSRDGSLKSVYLMAAADVFVREHFSRLLKCRRTI